MSREIIVRVLSTHEFECRAVGSVNDALAAVATQEPDIVLLNVALGTDSDLEMHRALLNAHGQLPAVIFTTSQRDTFATMFK